MGKMVDRVHRELMDDDIAKIVGAYHGWRGDKGASKYEDTAGFCKASSHEEIKKNGYVLTPGRYVGAEEVADEGERYDVKMPRLITELGVQFAEASRLEKLIKGNLKGIVHG